MTDKTLKILLGIIAVNLTIQTVKDVGLFPTAYAQNSEYVQKVEICGVTFGTGGRFVNCADIMTDLNGIQRLPVLERLQGFQRLTGEVGADGEASVPSLSS